MGRGYEQQDLLALALMRVGFLRPKERLLLYELLESGEHFSRLTGETLTGLVGRNLKLKVFQPEIYLKQAEEDQKYLTLRNIQCTFYYNKDYPALLKTIYDPPLVLYYRGNLNLNETHTVAVVGTRTPDKAAGKAAYKFGFECADAGVPVISGLARGIDREVHQGCVDNKGRAVAILGSGVDCVYPVTNRRLAESILMNDGAIASEYPPGTPPAKYHFPARNRIISGLSDAVVIVQAPERSGALITADYALEQGRDLVVHETGVEGIVSAGSRALVQDGARVVSSCDNLYSDVQKAESAGNLNDIFQRAVNQNGTIQEMNQLIEMEIQEKIVVKNGEYYWRN